MASVQEIVAQQAEDDGLWFVAQTASEAYLQQELRRLHAAVESEWLPIESAPKDGTPFLSLNHDNEVWLSKHVETPVGHRLVFRTNKLWEPKHFIVHNIDGKQLLEDVSEESEQWHSHWSYWCRGYDFRPRHWMPLPPPPEASDAL